MGGCHQAASDQLLGLGCSSGHGEEPYQSSLAALSGFISFPLRFPTLWLYSQAPGWLNPWEGTRTSCRCSLLFWPLPHRCCPSLSLCHACGWGFLCLPSEDFTQDRCIVQKAARVLLGQKVLYEYKTLLMSQKAGHQSWDSHFSPSFGFLIFLCCCSAESVTIWRPMTLPCTAALEGREAELIVRDFCGSFFLLYQPTGTPCVS